MLGSSSSWAPTQSRSAAEWTDMLQVRAIQEAAVMLPLTRCSPLTWDRRASTQNSPSRASIATRRPSLLMGRSSQAANSRIADISFERGVPPSPNMREVYQTDVRMSSTNLREPSTPSVPEPHQTPPQLPLPSPSSRNYALEHPRHHPNPTPTPPSQSRPS